MSKELPNNLRMRPNGTIVTADGTDLSKYLKKTPLVKSIDIDVPIVILTRENFLKLCRDAYILRTEVIKAA